MTEYILQTYGLLGVFITLILEVGLFVFPLPADSIIFATGILIEANYFNLTNAYFTIFFASIISGHLGYFIGKKFGIEKIKHNKIFSVDEKHIEKTKEFFKKYGAIAIIFSRFIPIIRNLISPILGVINYNKYNFAFYNFLASVLWPAAILWLGITFGKIFPNILKYIEYILLTTILVSTIPIIYKIIIKSLRNKNK
jgi:membrane-associated protein